MEISALETPALLLDWDRVSANCANMADRARRLGVRLRPHVKTHKCAEIAALQVGEHFGGITVSTLAEARAFKASGFHDITLAVPLAPERVAEAADLGLNLLVDSMEGVDAIESLGRTEPVATFLKVDCGYGRAGVVPESVAALALAERLHRSSCTEFLGVLTHGGHSYDCVGADQIRRVAEQERDAVVGFAATLRSRGVPCPEVSVGSTPTMMHVESLEGVTEIRPGNYAVFDAFQAAIGSCSVDDVAVSVLGTVISAHPDRAILNLGALALSKDAGPVHVDPHCGYGLVFDELGCPMPSLRLVSLSQEHGKLRGSGVERLRVGDRLRVVPNHSCLTMACFDTAVQVSGQQILGTISPCRGW